MFNDALEALKIFADDEEGKDRFIIHFIQTQNRLVMQIFLNVQQ